jgi:hypothetical protein
MVKVELKIDAENTTLNDHDYAGDELARIFRTVADRLEGLNRNGLDDLRQTLHDINGDRVGLLVISVLP